LDFSQIQSAKHFARHESGGLRRVLLWSSVGERKSTERSADRAWEASSHGVGGESSPSGRVSLTPSPGPGGHDEHAAADCINEDSDAAADCGAGN
jgi:hypothetical protein